MAERRPLVAGVVDQEPPREEIEAFVFGTKAKPPAQPAALDSSGILPQFVVRVPLTTRVSPEVASAVKRASLTRQLQGQEPFHVQEIMEEALVAWLKRHGYTPA
jgi:hypothetical protein